MVYLPPTNEVWGKLIFSVACVKNSVHRGGLPQCMLGYPRGPGTPPDQAPPPTRYPPDQAPPWISACWGIWSTSGRYASYWNAILFNKSYRLTGLWTNLSVSCVEKTILVIASKYFGHSIQIFWSQWGVIGPLTKL